MEMMYNLKSIIVYIIVGKSIMKTADDCMDSLLCGKKLSDSDLARVP